MELEETKQKVRITPRKLMMIPVAIGVCLGLAIGTAMGYAAIGLVVGIVAGGVGAVIRMKQKKLH